MCREHVCIRVHAHVYVTLVCVSVCVFFALCRQAGHTRQLEACLKKTKISAQKSKAIVTIAETISGMLPLAKREHLVKLIQDPRISEVHVESCRAVARKAVVAEAMWELSKKHKTKIICADYPELFKHNCSPAESFIRKVVMATTELHRDIAVESLSNGLKEAKKRSKCKTQTGGVKFNGRMSYLEQHYLTKTKKLKLKKLAKNFHAKTFGSRELARQYSTLLSLPKVMSHMTAKRMASEVESLK